MAGCKLLLWGPILIKHNISECKFDGEQIWYVVMSLLPILVKVLDRPNKTESDPHRESVRHFSAVVLMTSPTRLIEVCHTWRPKQPLGNGPGLHCVYGSAGSWQYQQGRIHSPTPMGPIWYYPSVIRKLQIITEIAPPAFRYRANPDQILTALE